MSNRTLTDSTQDNFSKRTVKIARELAHCLITDKGLIDQEALQEQIQLFEQSTFCLDLPMDDEVRTFYLETLHFLTKERRPFKQLFVPNHRGCKRLIRQTLNLSENSPLTDIDAKKAVIAALFTYLRQSVGSCFATAPAILIQKTQKEQLLQDLLDLISTGRLTRIIDGKEFTVPLCQNEYEKTTAIFSSQTDNALLRAWEYTLASMAESKADFATWNLYSSLGLSPDEPNGIGIIIKESIQEQLKHISKEIEELQSKYDHLFATAKYLEGRMKRASEREIGWLTADYQIRRQEISRLIHERDKAAARAQRLSEFFEFSLKFLIDKFKDYFQEVYDPQMRQETDSVYDDSPAGFRLLYKHGRSNSALWSLIYNEKEFVAALSAFFSAIEVELVDQAEPLKKDISVMITRIAQRIQSADFTQSAIRRLQKQYNDTKRLPWAYVSGGTLATVVSCYYHLPDKPKVIKRWVESPTELLAFYIDALKDQPLSEQQKFRKNKERSLLAYSPTHAFLVQPSSFIDAWDNDTYTYTWIKDQLVNPALDFLQNQKLDEQQIQFLVEKLPIRGLKFSAPLRPEALVNQYPQLADAFNALLFEHLPFCQEAEVPMRLKRIFGELDELSFSQKERLYKMADELKMKRLQLISSADLLELAKRLLLSLLQTTHSSIPFHQRIVHIMKKLGFSYPAPLIFGDTNWVRKRFGFVVSPGSKELELWCVENCGSNGSPLSIWKPYLDGTQKKEWGLYNRAGQYGQ